MRKTRRDREKGAGLVEYSLLVALISLVMVGALDQLENKISEKFEDAAFEIEA